MDKNSGGAKPKTGTTANNNNSNNLSGSGSLRPTVNQARNRSPRREAGPKTRNSGGRGSRSNQRDGDKPGRSNASSSSSSSSSNTSPLMSFKPNGSTGQNKASSSNTPRKLPSPSSENHAYKPLRKMEEFRERPRRTANLYRRPMLPTYGMRSVEPAASFPDPPQLSPLEEDSSAPNPLPCRLKPLGDPDGCGDALSTPASVPPPCRFSSLGDGHQDILSSDDSDSDSPSPTGRFRSVYFDLSESDREGEAPAMPSALYQLSPPAVSRPISSSPDASYARQVLQQEVDLMVQRDEELARQLHDQINREDQPHPLAMLLPQGGLRSRSHHFPTIPGRFGARGGDRHTQESEASPFLLSRRPDGSLTMGFRSPGRERPSMRFMMGLRGQPGRRRPYNPQTPLGPDDEPAATSPGEDGGLPSGEFDPDERLLQDEESGPPDDFLSMMNDPSLMLLMLLLRAPETMNHTEGGVDLEDYDGLWELAERLGEVRRRGITEEQISRLATHKFKSGASEACSAAEAASLQCQICLVDFEHGDCLRCIPCKHDFHRDCLDQWLKRNATCPICRQDIQPED